jgi:cyclopropane-fatty-acyl-phospholipid synthase
MKQLIQPLISEFDIKIHNEKFLSSLLFNPSLRAGEAYMEGEWDCDHLDSLFAKIQMIQLEEQFSKTGMRLLYSILTSIFNMQSKLKSKKVAEIHYNLGNDLYEAMLGNSMAYTCAYWKRATTLDQAQYDKYDLVCKKANLQKGDKVLELGCGFGGFARHAAQYYGCEVICVNISTEQVKQARNLCKGLPVTLHLCDYRDEHIYNPDQIKFDKVISIGLCEHIGYKNYRQFMEIAWRNLKDHGIFVLHTIGGNESKKSCDPWIDKYIFPNGLIPSVKQLSQAFEKRFVMEDWHNFSADYDKTLLAWFQNFDANWPKLQSTYGDKFYRMWKYYLLLSAGGFRARTLQLWQIVLSKNGIQGGYQSIR